ncbi:glycine zipper 2TM domain-containing protein [Noviherbaspirillum malthae]|jgi:outer membrane lipoprotein SlyB|uniref:glycine zipper 2TM domain-containing protein n=1 Tax=Noviherbaspirillum malthae TaxID=1260987 RepID=UPI00188EB4A1|nr:glycine zipper 2TM domain-containing protein [Noviherbaspirillum malthae]
MESDKTTSRIHPLVAGAAVSVMLVSLTGVAAMTGMIPNSHSSSPTSGLSAPGATVSSSIGAAAAATSPAALLEREQTDTRAVSNISQADADAKVEHRQPSPSHQSGTPHHGARQFGMVAQAPAACKSCGRVESVQAIQQAAQPSGVGMVAGAVLGGVLGNQIGGGSGRKIATVAGAVGGGYAGNEVEKRTRATTTYQVRVRMNDGVVRSFPFNRQPAWSTGDKVRVVNGHLTARI